MKIYVTGDISKRWAEHAACTDTQARSIIFFGWKSEETTGSFKP
jgi:hypothetical protein